jgi:hypothetical protein
MENGYGSFRNYNYQMTFAAGVDKVEAPGRKVSGHGYVVGEVCQTENPLIFHLRKD